MPSAQCFREFVNERLTAAAEEIFGVFLKTIVVYEEEIDRQRKLLNTVWKPGKKTHGIELPQQCELLTDQQLFNQDRNSSLDQKDPEPPQIKEEQEELCTSQLVVKLLTSADEESDHGEPELQELPQQHVGKEEEVVADQQLFSQERIANLDQEEPEPLQIKEEQEELCTSQEGEQLVVKVETDDFMLNPSDEETDYSEAELENDYQPLSHNSYVAESQNQRGGEHGDTGSTRDVEPESMTRHHTSESHSSNENNSNWSEIQLNALTGETFFRCSTCGKDFKYLTTLQVHLKKHKDETPHMCTICGKDFQFGSRLKIHMRSHTGEKPYLCNTCGKSFGYMSGLIKHARIHTGEKPY